MVNPCGGRRCHVVTPIAINGLIQLVEENPAFTLVQTKAALATEEMVLSTSSIACALDSQLIWTKKLYNVLVEQNSKQVKEECSQYTN